MRKATLETCGGVGMHEVLAGGPVQRSLGGGKRFGMILRRPRGAGVLDGGPYFATGGAIGGLANLGLPLVFLR
jgi:hypothetical protein